MQGGVWIFAYGSLIWRPEFRWRSAQLASVAGWARRFWQGSHDHRGTPTAPGRVVTLVQSPAEHCVGLAYLLDHRQHIAILGTLDRREQNGYERVELTLRFRNGSTQPAIAYVALPGNPAWLGAASPADMALQIATCTGPSGSNRQYLLELSSALDKFGIVDTHIGALVRRVQALG